jgi:hypothetical protein
LCCVNCEQEITEQDQRKKKQIKKGGERKEEEKKGELMSEQQTFSLSGTPIASQLKQAVYGSKTPSRSQPFVSTVTPSRLANTRNSLYDESGFGALAASTGQKGYLFQCPGTQVGSDCKLLHPIRRFPGQKSFVVDIMDHVRIDRNNQHVDNTPLNAQEKAAVSTQLDPFGQLWIRGGDNRDLFLPGGIYNKEGFVLHFDPNATWKGEKGAWDIRELVSVPNQGEKSNTY